MPDGVLADITATSPGLEGETTFLATLDPASDPLDLRYPVCRLNEYILLIQSPDLDRIQSAYYEWSKANDLANDYMKRSGLTWSHKTGWLGMEHLAPTSRAHAQLLLLTAAAAVQKYGALNRDTTIALDPEAQ